MKINDFLSNLPIQGVASFAAPTNLVAIPALLRTMKQGAWPYSEAQSSGSLLRHRKLTSSFALAW
jgi:hypothetical protein